MSQEHGISAHPIGMAGPLGGLSSGPRLFRNITRPIVEVARAVAAVRFLRRVDTVVVPGTGILDDFGVRPWQMPYDLFRWSLACRLTRTKLVYLSVGAGPIENRLSRVLMKRAVGFADFCSFRDETSRSYMAGIGRDVSHDEVAPDLAFGLDRPPLRLQSRREGPLNVGLGVMSFRGWSVQGPRGDEIHEKYVAELVEFGNGLLDAGHTVTLLIGEDADEPAARRIHEELERHGSSSDPETVADRLRRPPQKSMDDVLEAISTTDIVVATRFHNVVAALMMRRPAVSLGYARKNRDVLDAAGLVDCSEDIEGFSANGLTRKFEDLVGRQGTGYLLAKANREFGAALARQYQDIVGSEQITANTCNMGDSTLEKSRANA